MSITGACARPPDPRSGPVPGPRRRRTRTARPRDDGTPAILDASVRTYVQVAYLADLAYRFPAVTSATPWAYRSVCTVSAPGLPRPASRTFPRVATKSPEYDRPGLFSKSGPSPTARCAAAVDGEGKLVLPYLTVKPTYQYTTCRWP